MTALYLSHNIKALAANTSLILVISSLAFGLFGGINPITVIFFTIIFGYLYFDTNQSLEKSNFNRGAEMLRSFTSGLGKFVGIFSTRIQSELGFYSERANLKCFKDIFWKTVGFSEDGMMLITYPSLD